MTPEIDNTCKYLVERGIDQPEIGIILGTGLGALADEIEIVRSIPYGDIPHFPVSTVEFHKGELIYGFLGGKKVLAMKGRFHYYEGYRMEQVVYPVRVMHELGIKSLLVSNAAGNLNKEWNKSELMLLTDHLNFMPDNPLRGQNAAKFGNIFVDMSEPYNETLNNKIRQISADLQITLREGVYAALAGPNLETKAEYRFLQIAGADAVGMSTVPEVIAANQLELPCCAISVMTDDCDPETLKKVEIEEILAAAAVAEKDLVTLTIELCKRI